MRTKEIRRKILELTNKVGEGHVTSCFSCLEILDAIFLSGFFPLTGEKRVRFVLSKGHGALALYLILEELGMLGEKTYDWCQNSPLGLHLSKVDGVECASGSLGQGLGIAAGMALAKPTPVFCLVGDAELTEGSCWEALFFIAAKKLAHITVIVDWNGRGVIGRLDDTISARGGVSSIQCLEKLSGFQVDRVDGHDTAKIVSSLLPVSTKPKIIIARTIKGKGVPFIEDKDNRHGVALVGSEYNRARKMFL